MCEMQRSVHKKNDEEKNVRKKNPQRIDEQIRRNENLSADDVERKKTWNNPQQNKKRNKMEGDAKRNAEHKGMLMDFNKYSNTERIAMILNWDGWGSLWIHSTVVSNWSFRKKQKIPLCFYFFQ